MGMFSAYIFIQTQRNAVIVLLEVFDAIRTQREREKTEKQNRIREERDGVEEATVTHEARSFLRSVIWGLSICFWMIAGFGRRRSFFGESFTFFRAGVSIGVSLSFGISRSDNCFQFRVLGVEVFVAWRSRAVASHRRFDFGSFPFLRLLVGNWDRVRCDRFAIRARVWRAQRPGAWHE